MNIKKKILVTGGAGFVGSHLCERLSLDKKNDVYSLDNYFTGSEDNHVSDVKYIKGEVSDISELITFVPDMIFHLGEYSRVEQSFDDIDLVWRYNNDSIYPVLEFVRKVKCKIIYAGSSTKYGDSGEGKSSSPYAWTKSKNTELVVNYGKWFDISYAITYFYNVYGPREIANGRYATLIALFKEKIKNNESLTVVSPGTQIRNFTHVYDIVSGLILSGEKLVDRDVNGQFFELGSGENYSINQLADAFGEHPKVKIPKRPGEMRETLCTDTLANELLGWEPKENLIKWVKETI